MHHMQQYMIAVTNLVLLSKHICLKYHDKTHKHAQNTCTQNSFLWSVCQLSNPHQRTWYGLLWDIIIKSRCLT